MNNDKHYKDFLEQKRLLNEDYGFEINLEDIHKMLFPFQKDIVKWAIQKGKSCVFADCGLGKTFIQLEWARIIYEKTKENILIIAPLAVSRQTKREAEKIDLNVNVCRSQDDVKPGINITNYEILEKFDTDKFIGIVLDESSILKNYTGKIKTQLVKKFKNAKYKLACTATPSPNDHMEILNHSEFLGIMKSREALAIWFINDTMHFGTYRLKNYAVEDFWEWVASWAISLASPSDLGYEDGDFILPKLNIIERVVIIDQCKSEDGELFRLPSMNATSYHKERRLSTNDRVNEVLTIINKRPNDIFCIWCDTNYEADALMKAIPESVEVRGDDKITYKEEKSIQFASGEVRILISKPSIFGHGLNFQICHNIIFCGLSYSYESFYQAIRRFYRFGQKSIVNCYIVIGSTEYNVLQIIKGKEEQYQELKTNMYNAIIRHSHINNRGVNYKMEYQTNIYEGNGYKLIEGDAVEEIKKIESNSVDMQIFSPPFSQLYIYSDSYRDMGNNKNDEEFFKHFGFMIPELFRILTPGRLCLVHCKNLVDYINRDGESGLRDFRGEIIREFQKHGFKYHTEYVIWKDPVTEMYRTKSHGLLYNQLRKDSSYSRAGLPDYLVGFRKWCKEENDPKPVNWKTKENFELPKWQKYASPVWFDIRQTNVLNIGLARAEKDEKHICPLQLDVIERAVEMYSNPNDLIFSPFAGIGSEGFVSIKLNRRFLGIELKPEYAKIAVKNLESAIEQKDTDLIQIMEA